MEIENAYEQHKTSQNFLKNVSSIENAKKNIQENLHLYNMDIFVKVNQKQYRLFRNLVLRQTS